jgi:hypothetical protein
VGDACADRGAVEKSGEKLVLYFWGKMLAVRASICLNGLQFLLAIQRNLD